MVMNIVKPVNSQLASECMFYFTSHPDVQYLADICQVVLFSNFGTSLITRIGFKTVDLVSIRLIILSVD